MTTAPRPISGASRQDLARLQELLAGDADGSGTEAGNVGAAGGQGDSPGEVPATREASQAPREATEDGPLSEPAPLGQVEDALSGKVVSFHWRFWIGEQWLLVSRCPDAASRGLEDRLAANILRALGDGATAAEALRWPVFSNPAVPGNDAAGAVEVISGMAETIKRPRQLWLGLEPDDLDDTDERGVWQQVIASLGEATVSSAASLAALSSDPGAKKALWHSLQQSGRS